MLDLDENIFQLYRQQYEKQEEMIFVYDLNKMTKKPKEWYFFLCMDGFIEFEVTIDMLL